MIGRVLSDYRYASRMGIRELSQELRISTATLSRIENGNQMDQRTMMKIINFLFSEKTIKGGRRQK